MGDKREVLSDSYLHGCKRKRLSVFAVFLCFSLELSNVLSGFKNRDKVEKKFEMEEKYYNKKMQFYTSFFLFVVRVFGVRVRYNYKGLSKKKVIIITTLL